MFKRLLCRVTTYDQPSKSRRAGRTTRLLACMLGLGALPWVLAGSLDLAGEEVQLKARILSDAEASLFADIEPESPGIRSVASPASSRQPGSSFSTIPAAASEEPARIVHAVTDFGSAVPPHQLKAAQSRPQQITPRRRRRNHLSLPTVEAVIDKRQSATSLIEEVELRKNYLDGLRRSVGKVVEIPQKPEPPKPAPPSADEEEPEGQFGSADVLFNPPDVRERDNSAAITQTGRSHVSDAPNGDAPQPLPEGATPSLKSPLLLPTLLPDNQLQRVPELEPESEPEPEPEPRIETIVYEPTVFEPPPPPVIHKTVEVIRVHSHPRWFVMNSEASYGEFILEPEDVTRLLTRARMELASGEVESAHTFAEAAAESDIPIDMFKSNPDLVLSEIEYVTRLRNTVTRIKYDAFDEESGGPDTPTSRLKENPRGFQAIGAGKLNVRPKAINRDGEEQRMPELRARKRLDSLPAVAQVQGFSRGWSSFQYSWEAPAAKYSPLYLEDAELERYGNEYCWGQSIVSAGMFFLSVPSLPYQMAIEDNSPWSTHYDLGYDRPGEDVCASRHTLPFSWTGLVAQGLVGSSVLFAVP